MQPVVVPADWIEGAEQGCWDYETYARVPDDGKRHEVVEGVLYILPTPNIADQLASMETSSIFGNQ